MSAYTNSLRFQSSGVTSLLATLSPISTVLLAHLFLKDEPLDAWRIMGALIAFVGAGILLVRGESGLAGLARADWRGYAWALLGMTSNSAGLVFARRYLRSEDPFVVTSIRILVGAAVVSILAGVSPGFDFSNVRLTGILALGYAAVVGTFLAFLFYLMSVQRFGATVASKSEYVVPLAATGLGVLILGEQVTPTMLAGMAVIFLGLAVYDRGSWLNLIPGLDYFFRKPIPTGEDEAREPLEELVLKINSMKRLLRLWWSGFRRWLNEPRMLWRSDSAAVQATIEIQQGIPFAAFLVTFIWYIAAPSPVVLMCAVILGGIVASAFLWARTLARGVEGQRKLRFAAMQVGDELEEQISLQNKTSLPVLWAEFVDRSNIPGYTVSSARATGPNSRVEWRAHTICTRRGVSPSVRGRCAWASHLAF